MPDGIPINTLISIGGILVAGFGAWFAVKFKVQSLGETVHQLALDIALQDKTDDKLVQTLAEVRAEIKYLRRDLDEVRRNVSQNRQMIEKG